jgi:hypothetical protein
VLPVTSRTPILIGGGARTSEAPVVLHATSQLVVDGRVMAENTQTHLLQKKKDSGPLGLS